MKTDKNAIGAAIAFTGMAVILVAVFVGGLWTKNAPIIRGWLIDLSYRASDFCHWLNAPQFWVGVCVALFAAILTVITLTFINRSEF